MTFRRPGAVPLAIYLAVLGALVTVSFAPEAWYVRYLSPLEYVAIIAGLAAVISIVFLFVWCKSSFEIPDLPPDKSDFSIIYPCALRHFREANHIARETWGRRGCPSFDTVKSWFARYPEGCCVITDRQNRIVGYFDIYPIREQLVPLLRSGLASETDLYDYLHPEQEHSRTPTYYFAGISVEEGESAPPALRQVATVALIKFVKQLILRHDSRSISIAALAYSKSGIRLARRFGLQLTASERERAAQGDLYEGTLTLQLLTSMSDRYRASMKQAEGYCDFAPLVAASQ